MLPQCYIDEITAVLSEMDQPPGRLRNWPDDGTRAEMVEPLITNALCERLTQRGYKSKPRGYSDEDFGNCDIVMTLPEQEEIWIEAKHYYTVFFDSKTETFSPSKGEGRWKAKIRSLLRDCRDKLLRWAPPSAHIAGLLLGFEIKSLPMNVRIYNPSAIEIDEFLQSEMKHYLPGWQYNLLSEPNGWPGRMRQHPEIEVVTRPMLLMPGDADEAVLLCRAAGNILDSAPSRDMAVLFPGWDDDAIVADQQHQCETVCHVAEAIANGSDPNHGIKVTRSELAKLIYYIADMLEE
jgi:hypothetical protein